ncbi:MAG: hypothetical protein KBT10_04280 [Bacteroidales bacterium]|nr:hypothetical protein [Candidatus Sodaliphilus aphodohippi]
MKKRILFLLASAAVVALSASAQYDMRPFTLDGATVDQGVTKYELAPRVVSAGTTVEALNTPSRTPAKVKVKAAAPEGRFVATYGSTTSNYGSFGSSLTLAVEGDSLAVNGFHYAGSKLKIKVNEDGSVSVPVQEIGTYNDMGKVVFAPSKMDGNKFVVDDSKTELTGTLINADSIQIDGEWGLFMPELENGFMYTGKNLVIARSNAVMTHTPYGGAPVTYNIIAKQNGNMMTFVNFANYGASFKTEALATRGFKFGGQKAYIGKAAAFTGTTYRIYEYVLEDGVPKATYTSDMLYGTESGTRTISWDCMWDIEATAGVVGYFNGGEIVFDFDVVYPEVAPLTLTGDGSEANPYLITNTDEWNQFATVSNSGNKFEGKFVKIAADLNFTGKQFVKAGVLPYSFNGTLDGGNHTVTMDYNAAAGEHYVALVSACDEKAVIKNVTVDGQITIADGNRCAAITGWMDYGTKIDNCHNKAAITVTGNGQVYAGIAAVGTRKNVISNSHNEGTITHKGANSNGFVGGIMGQGQECDLINCYNVGQIVIENTAKTGVVAGLAGRISFGKIENCYNTADITSFATAAGLIANAQTNSNGAGLIIKDCWNSGDIAMTNTASSTGPTAGLIATLPKGSTIENCYNTGNITGQKYVAGVVGNGAAASADYPSLIKNCWNSGNVTSYGTGAALYVGGVLGYAGNFFTLDSCYNIGNIQGERTVGGVAGHFQGDDNFFANSWNTGNVTSTGTKGYWVGGVIGNAANTFDITDCWNAGTISAPNRLAGIVGYSAKPSKIMRSWNVGDVTATLTVVGTGSTAGHSVAGIGGYSNSLVSDSYNAGKITGTTRVGGIEGFTTAATASKAGSAFERVINLGEIVCGADTCGHIAGNNLVNNPKQWLTTGVPNPNYIRDAFYLNTINDNCRTYDAALGIETGLNPAMMCALEIGEEWGSLGDYCYPVLAGYEDNPFAKLYAAAVVPALEETDPNLITMDFNVGAPEDLIWTSSYSGLTIDGNNAKFGSAPYEGKITLTATIVNNLPSKTARLAKGTIAAPTISRDVVINVAYMGTTGVDGINAGSQVTGVKYYNLQGIEVPEATQGMTIKVTTFANGTQQTAKIMK